MNHVTDQKINPNRQRVFCDHDKLGADRLSVCFNVFSGFQIAIFPAKYPSALWPLQAVVELILRLMNAIRNQSSTEDEVHNTEYSLMILRPHGILKKETS